jgi:LPXTG-motif cell wall-anchored protein
MGGDVGLPGTGGVLELIEVDTFSAANIEADTDPTNNWTALFLSVTGQNRTDLAAIGDTITGAEGDEAAAVVGIRNNGPATIDRSRVGSSAAVVHVTVPPGTTAIEVPSACQPQTEDGQIVGAPGDPGQPRYICAGTAMILPAGETVTFELTLRIDEVIPDAAGTVGILQRCLCDALPPEIDVDHSNNVAKILVNPTEPELPDTGNRVGLIAALGVLLLLLGTTAVVLALRRRQPAAN